MHNPLNEAPKQSQPRGHHGKVFKPAPAPHQKFAESDFVFRKFPASEATEIPSGKQGDSPLDSMSRRSISSIWWTHVWSGLIRDPTGKHYKGLKQAVWLYLYLLLGANWRTGRLFRKVTTISGDMGIPVRTITRWLSILRKGHYIDSTTSDRSLQISIKKWRPVSNRKRPPNHGRP